MDDTTKVETATPQAPSNEPVQAPAPPVVDNKSNPEVEAAKKEAEKAQLRARQLENEMAKIKADQEAAKTKELEEKEEYKSLYEKTASELKAIQDAQEETARKTALNAVAENVFQDYPENVVEVAKTTGLSLADDSEAAKAVLKEKLDAIKEKIGTAAPTVNPNNPNNPAPQEVNREELVARKSPGGESPMAMAGAMGDDSVAHQYISTLPAIQEMRKQAGLEK